MMIATEPAFMIATDTFVMMKFSSISRATFTNTANITSDIFDLETALLIQRF
jgi:hypothetical protein